MEVEDDRGSSLTAPSPLRRRIDGGVSKGWGSLAKILAIISTVPPGIHRLDLEPEAVGGAGAGRSGVDLSLRLGPPPGIGRGSVGEVFVVEVLSSPSESGDASVVEKGFEKVEEAAERSASPMESAAGEALTGEKSSVGECDPVEIRGESQGKAKEYSEITNDEEVEEAMKGGEEEVEEAMKGGEMEGRKRGSGGEGYLGLLLEAVRQVSGGFFDDKAEEKEEEAVEPSAEAEVEVEVEAEAEEEEEKRRGRTGAAGSKRRRACWTPPLEFYEDSGPVVRSKRGRSQALPSRYRDSVLEPWAKLPTVHRSGRSARPGTAR